VKCVCANARASVLGVPGCARGLEGDVVMWKQELAHRQRAWRHGEARAAAVRRGDAGARKHKVRRAAARQGSDAWDRREAGGGTDRLAATATGGEDQLGQTASGVARRGEASARPGSGGAGAGAARGLPQGGSGARRCTAHGQQSGGGSRAEEQRRERS
jgi:hypothetical protein